MRHDLTNFSIRTWTDMAAVVLGSDSERNVYLYEQTRSKTHAKRIATSGN